MFLRTRTETEALVSIHPTGVSVKTYPGHCIYVYIHVYIMSIIYNLFTLYFVYIYPSQGVYHCILEPPPPPSSRSLKSSRSAERIAWRGGLAMDNLWKQSAGQSIGGCRQGEGGGGERRYDGVKDACSLKKENFENILCPQEIRIFLKLSCAQKKYGFFIKKIKKNSLLFLLQCQ